MKNILLIIASLILISCPPTNDSSVDPSGSHLGGAKGGGSDSDRESPSSGQGTSK